MTQILVALAAAFGVLAVGLFLLTGRQVLARTRSGGHVESRSSIDSRDGDWIYGDRAVSARPARRRSSQSEAVSSPAGNEAEAIVRDAEREAAEIMARAHAERERLRDQKLQLERERALIDEKEQRLSDLLDRAIEELERVSANGSPNVGGLQELRDKLRVTK